MMPSSPIGRSDDGVTLLQPTIRLTLAGMLLALAAVAAPGALARAVPVRFDPACLPWRAARYEAEKLFLTVELRVSAQVLGEPPLAALRPVAQGTPLMPVGPTLALRVETEGPGWRTLAGELLLDAPTGAILQYAAERQPSPRFRVYRFTPTGPERWTARPRDDEGNEPRERWSDVDVKARMYPQGAVDGPVIEVTTLLYLLAASELSNTGDALEFKGYATSADALFDVTAAVGRRLRLPVDYRVTRPGTSESRRAVIEALPIRVQAAALAGSTGSTEAFDIMGLRDVVFLLDPERRVIAALRAQVPAVGSVQFQLQELELKASLPPRCTAPRAASGAMPAATP